MQYNRPALAEKSRQVKILKNHFHINHKENVFKEK
jgi:hypothetical protein